MTSTTSTDTMTCTDTIGIRRADPPFDDKREADVILRSTDNIDFYVYKSLLAYSSSGFKNKFSVAQGGPEGESKDGLQVISINETTETLIVVLRFAYPSWAAGRPALSSLDEFSNALESLRKYGMAGAEKLIIADLIAPRFVETEPLRVFTLACKYGLDAEARVAARQTLRIPFLDHPHCVEMKSITADNYYRLQEYHFLCGKVASSVANSIEWIQKGTTEFMCCPDRRISFGDDKSEHSEGSDADDPDDPDYSDGDGDKEDAKWWEGYMRSVAVALESRPLGSTVLGSELVDNASRNATKHSRCPPRPYAEMRKFGEMLAAEVDKATSKVMLNISL